MRLVLETMWGALQIAFHIALGPVLHGWRTRWGTTAEERTRWLPGDVTVPYPTWSYNHAITINAPRSRVWPWLVQLGQGRGGFYSYVGLERLVGRGIRNVEEIRPELQRLAVGDVIRMHRRGYGPFVRHVEHGRTLVLGSPRDDRGSGYSWAFYLFDVPGGRTRLLERGRHRPGRGLRAQLAGGPWLLDPVGFVMSRRMLRTVKRLAEATCTTVPPLGAAA